MATRIRIGIVGCGEATQLLHLPSLRELPDLFDVTAFADPGEAVLRGVAAGWPGSVIYAEAGSLVADPNVDAVLVACPNVFHAEVALAAMEQGKHVLIEKPMCVTRAEAEALQAAEQRFGVIAQVGYMRRHAPAFVQAVELVRGRREHIHYARVRDVIGPNAGFIGSTTPVLRGEVPREAIDTEKRRRQQAYAGEIGVERGPLALAYTLLLGLASHDISAMRELIGMPKSVLHASLRHNGVWMTSAFDYGGFVCQFETGIDSIVRFDAHLEVYMPSSIVRLDYQSPYVRHQPAILTVTEAASPAGLSVATGFTTRNDAFVAQWRAFHAHIADGSRPKCSLADASQDLALFRDMLALMRDGADD